jgi:hypothetical protein
MSDVDRYLEDISEFRQQRIRDFMEFIEFAVPGLQRRVWDYGGGVIGYGRYHYRYASGREGEFFMIGVGNRKRYVSIYSNAVDGDRYLVESFGDRFPGCKIGKSCIEAPDSVTVDDAAVADLTRQTVAFFRTEFVKPATPKSMQIWE